MYYNQEQIDRANQTDLVSFLQAQGEQLERAGNEYRWKRHDSLTVRGNKWYRHSQSKGGGPVDFLMEFFGRSFTEAVQLLTGEQGEGKPEQTAPLSDFRLPPRSPTAEQVKRYLTEARRIDEDVTGFFISSGDIYEEAAHHNAVFVGRDESGIPRYAHQRGTAGSFRLDVKGSDKAFNFCYRGEGERLFVFEAPIDLLSFLCLFKKEWQKQSYLALGGVGEKALLRFLSDRPNIKTVYLCLDSDQAGNDACSRLVELMPEGLTVHRLIPLFKDWNEVQTRRGEIADGKYIREAIYGLKEPPQEETVEIIRMSEVETQTVEWLWEPYIPFGKVTIVQGNPGEGKTTFALRLAAACTTGRELPNMKPLPPFNVIYQTAEDGLGDTVKPRLMEAEADLDRVLVIDEAKRELTLSDERIEKAIMQNGARLIILDPIQAYMGDKALNFCYRGEGERLFVFEAPIDLLSFLCLFKKDWQKQSYLSLGGVGEKALLRFLSDRPSVKTIFLCLDSDEAGNDACSRLVKLMPEGLTVNRLVPLYKDWNEVQTRRGEITDGKYLREAVYGLKEPQPIETVEIIRMSEVDTQAVEWLWEPYIPFGKVTIVQGNPGEGKTTFALRLAAACTTGRTLPNMKPLPPFNVIYQTAEDGLGDTVKPRLMEADADLDRVLVIDEAKQELTLSDQRIERAITQTGARLIILDPIQAYMGEKADMNRANEVRPIFRRLADVAERTGCAVILIGHLNKAAGGQSAYRGLGSIDFRAAARSVLLIGRVKREPNIRVIVHDKSSLAPEGKPVAFCLDPETGFEWIGAYDITADELLSGAGGNSETKTEQAERLLLDLLTGGKELLSEDVLKAAAEAGISERTLKNARRNLDSRIAVIRRGNQWYYRLAETKSAKQECKA